MPVSGSVIGPFVIVMVLVVVRAASYFGGGRVHPADPGVRCQTVSEPGVCAQGLVP
jgi:hypothetical protein